MNYLETEIENLKKRLSGIECFITTESDLELKKLAEEEATGLREQITLLENSVGALQEAPKDFRANHDSPLQGGVQVSGNECFLEVRAGTGGDEATIFAEDLFRMYLRFSQLKGWKTEDLSSGRNQVLAIKGPNCFNTLKNESGVHRVQRVPVTEKNGRIHTSTATVAVMPVVPATEVELRSDEIKVEFFRGGGHGGQNVNKVETGVRLIHLPTGVIVECVENRFQEQNRRRAEEMLRSKIYTLREEKQKSEVAEMRSSQVGTGDRSEKIKTYNFPQDRLTDHRVNKTWHNLPKIMGGEIPLGGED